MNIDFESKNNELSSPDLILKEIIIDLGLKYCVKNNFEKILNLYNSKYKNFGEEEIKNEINTIKKEPTNYVEIIASLIRVAELEFHFHVRNVQLISLLICVLTQNNNGLIEEIKTGEGKTLIISFLAVIYGLNGKKVDILTSSSVLAQRDSLSLKKFYSYYGLTTDYCKVQNKINDKNNNFDCYNSNICYGDSVSFEGDILRSMFLDETGRGNRPFDYIIVDEIDNLCIDNLRNQTELLDNFPGYRFLDFFYLYIYHSLEEIIENQKINEINDFIKMKVIHQLDKKIRDFLYKNENAEEKDKIYYPANLQDFIENRINGWCHAAFCAMFEYELDRNYIINKDENNNLIIQPIDFNNTGTIQHNSVWSGLHQFLQIKHGLRLTTENLNSCFISNLTFFQLYKKLNGFTGTLGSLKTQDAISKIYNVDLVKIPTFKNSKFIQYNNISIKSNTEYENALLNAIDIFAIKNNRSILLIFEYIIDAKNFYDICINKFKNINHLKLILYLRDDQAEEHKFLNEPLQPNTVIFSTNLAGRGTDIKINEKLESLGGLHVILTFMPRNKRIEYQALGRAARKGEKGSGQIIMKNENSYEQISKMQLLEEESEFNYLIYLYTPKINLFHKFFMKFSEKLKKLKNMNISNYIIDDIKEQWSLFIFNNKKENKEKSRKKEDYQKLFKLEEELLKDNFEQFMTKAFINNYDNYNYNNPFILIKNISKFDALDRAIKISPLTSLGAYYIKSYSLINHKVHNYQNLYIECANKLKKLFCHLYNQYDKYLKLIYAIKKDKNYYHYLEYQTKDKKSLMKDFYNNVYQNINKIDTFKQLDNKNYNNDVDSNQFDLFIDKITKFDNYENPINKDILDYFIDYGLCLFYDIDIKPNSTSCLKKIINTFFN